VIQHSLITRIDKERNKIRKGKRKKEKGKIRRGNKEKKGIPDLTK